jgi:hypothetical protein
MVFSGQETIKLTVLRQVVQSYIDLFGLLQVTTYDGQRKTERSVTNDLGAVKPLRDEGAVRGGHAVQDLALRGSLYEICIPRPCIHFFLLSLLARLKGIWTEAFDMASAISQ